MQDEASLVGRARQRDEEAWTRLYEANFDRIYRYVVLKIGERTEAEDITQQVFVNAIKAIGSYDYKGTPFSAWLYRIAHNKIVDYLRKKSKQPLAPLSESLVDNAPGNNPHATAYHNLDMEMVQQATKRLTPAQQEVIALRFSGDLSIIEVARAMGKSEGAVKALQHSAVLSLRKILGED